MNNLAKGFVRFIATLVSVLLICAVASMLICNSQSISVYADSADSEDQILLNTSEEVLSYLDVFDFYYNQASDEVKAHNLEMPYSFDDFCDGYYESDMDIQEYTDFIVGLIYDSAECSRVQVLPISAPGISTCSSSSSKEVKYILRGISKPSEDNFDPPTTPASAFDAEPKYGIYDYSAVQVGDIILETDVEWYLNGMGHTAFVYDINKPSEYVPYIQTIEAVGDSDGDDSNDGVCFGLLDDTRVLDFGVVILRVTTASSSDIETAKGFVYSQLGKKYSLPLTAGRVNTSKDSESWYCSELIYAAYYNADINLYCIDSGGWCFPYDIYNSSFTKLVQFSNFLDIKLIGKSGSYWQIRVYNNGGSDVTCYYNSKMCNVNDGREWTGLSDVTSVNIGANSYETVEIKTNWFARSIAISRMYDGNRYVSSGVNLNNATLRMTVNKVIVESS
ncbi:MAG: hypothetical protein LUE27_06370 [Clostridia bacterium]|nr:hypothetical protein [Clostridia bacterium]